MMESGLKGSIMELEGSRLPMDGYSLELLRVVSSCSDLYFHL